MEFTFKLIITLELFKFLCILDKHKQNNLYYFTGGTMRFVTFLLTTILCITFFSTGINAYTKVGRTKKEKDKDNEQTVVIQFKQNLVMANGYWGYLQGNANKMISQFGDNSTDQMLFGFGISYDRFINSNLTVGFNYSYLFKYFPGSSETSLRSNLYGINGSYYLTGLRLSRPYVKAELGRVSSSVHSPYDRYSNLDIESVSYYKIGLGIVRNPGHGVATRFELYYQNILSSDIDPIFGYEAFNISYIGFTISFGMPL